MIYQVVINQHFHLYLSMCTWYTEWWSISIPISSYLCAHVHRPVSYSQPIHIIFTYITYAFVMLWVIENPILSLEWLSYTFHETTHTPHTHIVWLLDYGC